MKTTHPNKQLPVASCKLQVAGSKLPPAGSLQPATLNLQPVTRQRRQAGFAQGTILMLMLVMIGITLVILTATINRTSTVATLNERNNQLSINSHAAEAAVEKAVARMSYDFQNYGLGQLNLNLPAYRTNIPSANESTLWRNFEFSDGQSNIGRTFVAVITNYSGPLPSQYPGRTCINSPVYRVLSNVRAPGSRIPAVTAAVQVDVLAALVPITQWAIFYNGLLEFSSCAPMTVNGAVHANGNVYTGSGSVLTLNGTVTTTGTQTSPANNGSSAGSWTHKGVFNGNPKKSENVPTINLSIGTSMTNVHAIIEPPAAGVMPTNSLERARLFNLAQVVIQVSNTTVTARIQNAPSAGEVPGSDPAPIIITAFRTNLLAMATNFPFLTVTNTFVDQRESYTGTKRAYVADVDLIKYKAWITNSFVTAKTVAPTILYVANNTTPSSTVMPVVRLKNGQDLPANSGLGFTVATHNPLYVWGHYNQPNSGHLGTTNTTATVPAALMSDALTILSANWVDSASLNAPGTRDAASTTVNAAILTGVMPSTGTGNTQFSGGVHNLPRLLEDWLNTSSGQRTLTLNTSIISLFPSKTANTPFRNPIGFGLSNPYYDPPVRQFSYDLNFRDYDKTPPGIPTALVLIRKDWAMPPPGSVTYYASP